MIEHIEKLDSELHIKVYGDFTNMVILEHGKIEIYQTRPVNRIAAHVA